MATPNRKPERRRRYRVNLIKATYPYDTNEIGKLFLIGSADPIENFHFEKAKPDVETEPAE